MTGCAELAWQGNGIGVKVPDIPKVSQLTITLGEK